jgi:hypothetical protein
MWGFLTGLLGLGGTISTITGQIAQVRLERAKAETDQERIHADERIKALEAKREVLIAEGQKSPVNMFVRAFLALPVGILLWKVFVYDKAFGQWTQGRTDALSPELWQVVMVVVGFYFLYETVRGK